MERHLLLKHPSLTATHSRMFRVATKELLHLCNIVSRVSAENND